MQRLEVSGAVRPIYGSLGVKRLKRPDCDADLFHPPTAKVSWRNTERHTYLVTVKLELSVRHSNTYSRSASIAPLILISTLDRCEWLISRSVRLTPRRKDSRYAGKGGTEGPGAGVDVWDNRKNLLPLPGFEPWIVHPVAWSLY